MKYKLYFIIGILVLSGSLFIIIHQANAVTFSTISGNVTDSNGKGIIVKAELVQGNVVYRVSSNINGSYSVTLPNGVYSLKFSDFNQTIPNAPAFYQVEKPVTISNNSTVNISIPFQTWTGSGLRDTNNSPYNGVIQIHVPLKISGYAGMSGDLVNVINGTFTFKLLDAPTSFTATIAGQNLGVNNCIGTSSSKTLVC